MRRKRDLLDVFEEACPFLIECSPKKYVKLKHDVNVRKQILNFVFVFRDM